MGKLHHPRKNPFNRRRGRTRFQDGWRVVWYDRDGKEAKKWVKTDAEAEALLAQKTQAFLLANTGMNHVATRLEQGHMEYVERAMRILDEHGFLNFADPAEAEQLVAAVNWFVGHYKERPADMKTVAELIALFLEAKGVKAAATRDDYEKNLNIFARTKCDPKRHPGKKYGELLVDEVSTFDISHFLKAYAVGKTTKSKYYGAVRALFYFAARKSEYLEVPLITDNPVLGILHPPKPTKPKRHRYTLDEVKRLIQASIHLRCAPIVVVRLFTMLRDVEATRLIAGPARTGVGRPPNYDPWDQFDLQTKKLSYHEPNEEDPADRDIKLYPVLVEWIKFFQQHGVPLTDSTLEQEARRLAAPKKFDGEFTNLIRHTAISFRAARCKSFIETAVEADNEERVIRKYYWNKVSKPDAHEMYALSPDKFDLRRYTDPTFPSPAELKAIKRAYPGVNDFLHARS